MARVFQRCKEEWKPPCAKARCGHGWTVRYREPGGRTARQREKSFPLAKEANAFASKVENDKNEGIYLDPKRGAISVRVWIEMWLTDHPVGDATYSNYSGFLRNHVEPVIGNMTIAAVKTEHVQKVVNQMRTSGLAASTINDRFDIVFKLFNAAIRSERVRRNPCIGVELPRAAGVAVNPDSIPSHEIVVAIHDAIASQYKLTVWLMAGEGLRISESLAFNSGCIRPGLIRVSQQISSKAHRADCKTRLTPLKHRAEGEYRDIPLLPLVQDSIDLHLEQWGTTTLINNDEEVEVFFAPRERGKGTMPTATTYRYHWVKAMKKLGLITKKGLPVYTPHDLRHFFASTALSNNVPILDVSRWLGHKSIMVTADIYGHLMPDAQERFVTIMQAALQPRSPLAVAA